MLASLNRDAALSFWVGEGLPRHARDDESPITNPPVNNPAMPTHAQS